MADYVVFFHQTGACRVFDSYNLAQATYPKQPIFTKPEDVPVTHVLMWYERLFEYIDSEGKQFEHGSEMVSLNHGSRQSFPKIRMAETLPVEQLRGLFWQLATQAGNRVTKFAPNNENGKRGKKKATGYRIDLVRANELLKDPALNIPGQAKAIIEFLTEQEFDHYTRDEMIKTCHSVKFIKAMKTRQDPWRIWRYYGPLLTKLGILR